MGGISEQRTKDAFVYDLIEKRLEQQIDSVKSLDTKASITLAVVGVLCSGVVQMMSQLRINGYFRLFAFFALASLVAAGVFGVLVFMQVRKYDGYAADWRNDPDPGKLLDGKDVYSLPILRTILMEAMVQSYDHNRIKYKQRYQFLYFSWGCIGLTVLLLVIALSGGKIV